MSISLYQTEVCALMDLAVGEDRCAIWPCEEDETLCESAQEDKLWGSTAVRLCCFLVLQCGSRQEQTVDCGKVSLGAKTVTKHGGTSV